MEAHELKESPTKSRNDALHANVGKGRIDAARVALPLVLAATLAILQIWGTIGSGYFAGWGDHFVLSVEGLKWAHPGAFANDWFMGVAPQPHWFFDVLTFVGESMGVLAVVYAAFWAIGLLAFGWATSILAYRFFPAVAWPVALGVAAVAAISPWMIGGTGSGMISQALPAVLSANLIYLLVAGMLAERRLLVVILAPVIAVVHVQQGSIALVLVAAVLAVETVRTRRVDWFLVGALALTGGVVAFGLTLRPVASNLQDFVRICDEIIPYHCAAHMWTPFELASAVGLIILSSLSGTLVPREARWIWFATVGLATLGYAGGFVSDALSVPVLGQLAQGVNVYRLGAVMLPFAVWGALSPLLVKMSRRRMIILVAIWGVGWMGFLTAPGFSTAMRPRLVLLGLALLIPLVWLLVSTWRQSHFGERSGTAVLTAALLVLVVTGVSGGLTLRSPNFDFIGDPNLRQWGEQVREVVPEGEVIVASPRFEWVKLVTQRAVVADCKDVPYGGAAWDEWQTRLEALGGYKQCVAPGPLLYDDLSPEELVSVADRFQSDYIAVNPTHPETVEGLEDKGWTRVVEPVVGAGAEVLQRPRA